MSPTESYATILAVCGVLIEKGITTREQLEDKSKKIVQYLTDYNKLMLSDVGTKEEESKKMTDIDTILQNVAAECKFSFDSTDQDINRKLRDSIVEQRKNIKK